MINVHGLRRNVKNVVRNYSDAQIKVREATSNDPWGPSGTLMSEIADLTYNVVAFSEIMSVVWKRLNDHGKNWKHVYKALVLLEYLIKTGSEKVTQQCKESIIAIQTLRDFQYFEESKDQGVNVREKAKQLVALLRDDERLKNERTRALKARERFAQASNFAKHEPISKPYGSSEFSQSSLDDDMLSPGELEHARPQTAGEEELQLQLALAMSKEEADQAERLKRNDDLRLQMALSESKEEFKKVQVPEEKKKSVMDDLLGLSFNTNGNPPPPIDPWGMTPPKSSSATNDLWNTNSLLPERNHNSVPLNNDPWSPTSSTNSNTNLNAGSLYPNGQQNLIDSIPMESHSRMEGSTSLESFLGAESTLVDLDSTLRPRMIGGNPFQAAKATPLTINELRAQHDTPFSSATLPTNLPLQNNLFANRDKSPVQNPFM